MVLLDEVLALVDALSQVFLLILVLRNQLIQLLLVLLHDAPQLLGAVLHQLVLRLFLVSLLPSALLQRRLDKHHTLLQLGVLGDQRVQLALVLLHLPLMVELLLA